MGAIPKNPEEVLSEFTADLRAILKDDLVSLILYGSSVRGDYIRGKSDINFLIVTTEKGIQDPEKFFSLMSKWRKKRIAIPVLLTREDICSSLEVYPIEFLSMKRHYRVVFGEDVLAGLAFSVGSVRLQCERELQGKTLLLLQRFIETQGNPGKVGNLIAVSITAYLSIFKALLYLKGVEIPHERRDLVRSAAGHFAIDPAVFIRCIDLKENERAVPKQEIGGLFKAYLKETRKLTGIVAAMQS